MLFYGNIRIGSYKIRISNQIQSQNINYLQIVFFECKLNQTTPVIAPTIATVRSTIPVLIGVNIVSQLFRITQIIIFRFRRWK